ncbi:hypothetical protein C8J57DRAFT_1253949 [Mycena rebaudengoi]|nr:hypothetical protein C8J57DRAFT_1253949 [Mycena rebaudengoi]
MSLLVETLSYAGVLLCLVPTQILKATIGPTRQRSSEHGSDGEIYIPEPTQQDEMKRFNCQTPADSAAARAVVWTSRSPIKHFKQPRAAFASTCLLMDLRRSLQSPPHQQMSQFPVNCVTSSRLAKLGRRRGYFNLSEDFSTKIAISWEELNAMGIAISLSTAPSANSLLPKTKHSLAVTDENPAKHRRF